MVHGYNFGHISSKFPAISSIPIKLWPEPNEQLVINNKYEPVRKDSSVRETEQELFQLTSHKKYQFLFN